MSGQSDPTLPATSLRPFFFLLFRRQSASLTMADRDYEMSVSKLNVTEPKVHEKQEHSPENASILEKQTRTRRLFSSAQLFCFSLIYLVTWMGMGK